MNKKLLAMAVATAMAAPAAGADVVITGSMNIALSYFDAAGTTNDMWDLAAHDGTLTFRGTEALSDDLTAVWQMSLAVNMASDGNINGATSGAEGMGSVYNTFIGLTGSWGTFVMGRHTTPYNIATGSLDIFADTLADYNAAGNSGAWTVQVPVGVSVPTTVGGSIPGPIGPVSGAPAATGGIPLSLGFESLRVDNAIAYISPSMNGLTLAAAIVTPGGPDLAAATGISVDAGGLAEAWSLAALYGNGPFFGSLAYEAFADDAVADILGRARDKWKLGLGYTANGMHAGLVYEDADYGVFGGFDAKRWLLNGSYTFGNNVLKASYGQAKYSASSGGVQVKGDQWALGLDHNLSQRTKVYALYTDVGVKDNQAGGFVPSGSLDWDGFSFGMTHSF